MSHVTDTDNILEKYRFNFNYKWLADGSDTKKIKAYPMNLTPEIGFVIDDANNNQQHIHIHYPLIDNQTITALRIYIVSEINKFIDTLYPGIFPSTIHYLWVDYNKGKSIVSFASLIHHQLHPRIVLDGDSIQLFHIRQDYSHLIALENH
jgi:hypothetical protein